MNSNKLSNGQNIENLIFAVRGFQVMLDYHLAGLYGTETKRLNEQVKRNARRFPENFMMQLTRQEWKDLKSQFATSNKSQFLQSQIATSKRRTLPYVFTEQGVAMIATVLKSDIAIEASIIIMQAFVNMRKFLLNQVSVFQRLDQLELKQLHTDEKLNHIFRAMEAKQPQADKGNFFNGQIFDAYTLIADLIKKASNDIILIDNYVDETILTLLNKRNPSVTTTIYTKSITKNLQLDIEKHNAQYPSITLKTFPHSHDRFLLIDQKELYHIGASLKDLGKKWFAFSRMDSLAGQLLDNLKREAI